MTNITPGVDCGECWAAYLDGCDGGASREHLVSKALLPETTVKVMGFDWCPTWTKVGVNSLTRKILCRRHNSLLSSVDEVGLLVSRSLRDPIEAKYVLGFTFERWLLKTLINVSIGGDAKIGVGMTGGALEAVPPYLVDVAFGNLNFSHRMGLYFLRCIEPYAVNPGEIMCTPFVRDEEIGGALFLVAGMYFFLSLYPGHAPGRIGEMARGPWPEYLATAELVYRPEYLRVQMRDGRDGVINFGWDL